MGTQIRESKLRPLIETRSGSPVMVLQFRVINNRSYSFGYIRIIVEFGSVVDSGS